jgi:hypothetical protein
MKKHYKLTRQLAIAAALSVSAMHTMAQSDAASIIKAGTSDANKLMTAYAGPLAKSVGASLNSGWFQTAKPHGLGGFDITVIGNLVLIPDADKSYNVNNLGLQNVRLKAGQPESAPSVFGSRDNAPEVEIHGQSPFTNQDTAFTSFALPPGIGIGMLPVPMAQVSVGVGFGTEVSVRFMPTVKVQDLNLGLFGMAVKHDFKQWIPGMSALPFDLSAMFGFTNMSADLKFEGDKAIKPERNSDGTDNSMIYYGDASGNYDNQKMELKSKAWTTNIVISKKLGPFTPYLGVGYQKSTTDIDLLGTFPITVPNDPASALNPTNPAFAKAARITNITDPIHVSGTLSGMRATAGFRLKFALITIHGDYTFAEYNVASVGIGLNLQSAVPFKL